MLENKDYSKLTHEELLTEEKKIKKSEITSSVIIGILIGVIVYGIAKNGFGFLYIFIPGLIIYGFFKNSQKLKNKLKQIQTEISTRKAE